MFSLNLFSNQCLVDSFTNKNSNKTHIVKETELTYSDLCSVCYSDLVLINKYIFSHRNNIKIRKLLNVLLSSSSELLKLISSEK